MSAAAQAIPIGPVSREDRIPALDALRGVALLGILLMNIAGFAFHFASYDDPTVAGGATGANLWFWIVNHILFEGKMRALFSMLFGAGVIVLTERGEAKGVNMADVYYRRLLWLMLFGIAHAYLLWYGEILYPYALCGFVLYPFRKTSARGLIVFSVISLTVMTCFGVADAFEDRDQRQKAMQAARLRLEGKPVSEELTKAEEEYTAGQKENKPTAAKLQEDDAKWTGGFVSVFKRRAEIVRMFHGTPFYSGWNWDLFAMMFLGMALFKMGVISGQRSMHFYAMLALISYGVGVPLHAYTASQIVASNFDSVTHHFAAIPYEFGRTVVALGHMGLLFVIMKAGLLRRLTLALAAVGQMALTNYVMQSVICVTIFYVLGWHGKLQRIDTLYILLAIWTFQLIVSPLWLRAFRFGPLEWVWRSLTYWTRQPFRLNPAPAAAPELDMTNAAVAGE
ncbi:MAG: DUF418 domain-containing protein [Acidobacteriota bacterium]